MSQVPYLDITSANAQAVLTIEQLYPAGIVLQQFGTDAGLVMDALDASEVRMGVDGYLVAGMVTTPYPVTITLEASSPSTAALMRLSEAMVANKRVYACTLVCTLPSIRSVYTWSKGVLQNGTPFPSMLRVLAPTTWIFNFERCERAEL